MPRPKLPEGKHGVAKSIYLTAKNADRLESLMLDTDDTASGVINGLIDEAFVEMFGEDEAE